MAQPHKYELGQTLMLALADFQRRLDDDLKRRGVPGIRSRHRAVFIHLNRFGASRSVDLAAAASIRPQSMMKIVHELEELDLVTRREDPSDSRAKLIEFTKGGQELIGELKNSTEAVWDQYAAIVGPKELNRTLGSIRALFSENAIGES
ncbi:MAG: MarR family winged helix-turn-helix transcriptional regulator [Halioglobus sp.]